MISANFILSKLPPYTGQNKVLKKNQSVKDIKNAIVEAFNQDRTQYAAIAPYFVGDSVIETCENVFNFLRENVINITEGVELQSIKTPAAIIATGKTTGSDCKNYSLFVAGVLDAINRSGVQKIPIAFRFSKYKQFDGSMLDHVFVVVYPGRKNEIWVDCIKDVPYFNHRKTPDYFTDKKVNSMALVRMSGQPQAVQNTKLINGLINERNKRIASGKIKIGDKQDAKYIAALGSMGVTFDPTQIQAPVFNNQLAQAQAESSSSPSNWLAAFTNAGGNGINVANVLNGGNSGIDFGSGVSMAVNAAIPGAGLLVKPLFDLWDSIFGSKPNPNDWVGWDAQTAPVKGKSAAWWTITDGDNAKNEMLNVLSYMKNATNGLQNTFTAAYTEFNLTPQQFASKLIAKLNRTGFTQEAAQFQQQIATANTQPQQGNASDVIAPTTKKINPLLLVAGGLLLTKIL